MSKNPRTKKGWERKCLDKQNEILKKRSSGYCPSCIMRGASPQAATQPCHIFSRAHKGPLFEWSNVYFGCSSCNILYELDTGFIERIHQWWKEKIGQEEWDRLDKLWHTPCQRRIQDFKELFERLSNGS